MLDKKGTKASLNSMMRQKVWNGCTTTTIEEKSYEVIFMTSSIILIIIRQSLWPDVCSTPFAAKRML
jgi:hypothetical protein